MTDRNPNRILAGISFEGRFMEPRYDRTLGREQISQLSPATKLEGHVLAGLTHGTYETRVSVNVRVLPNRRGGACVQPVSVLGTVFYSDLTVYLAREYPTGSCQYRAVLEHENQHVAINRRYFERYIPRMRRVLEAATRRMGSFWVADPQTAGQAAADRLQQALKPTLAELERETRRANAAIDTPESYRQVSARCSDW